MHHSSHRVSDLMLDDAFVAWVKTRANDAHWQRFLHQHPEHRATVEQARSYILAAATQPAAYPDAEWIEATWDGIHRTLKAEPTPVVRPLHRKLNWRHLVAAASVVGVLVAGSLFFRKPAGPTPVTYQQLVEESRQPLLTIGNTENHARLVSLADGSTVLLQPGSQLSFPEHFQGQALREVYLSGEAFFEVAKNPRQPFVVYANELVTKVLGTSFTIRAYEADLQVTVTVKTGRVSVFSRRDPDATQRLSHRELDGLVLAPNQQIAYERTDNRLTRSLVERPQLLPNSIQHASFDFDDVPAPEVFAALEEAYGVDIVYDEDLLRNCKLTASLGDEPLFEKIRLLCVSLEGSYERMDGQIIIHAKGCSNL